MNIRQNPEINLDRIAGLCRELDKIQERYLENYFPLLTTHGAKDSKLIPKQPLLYSQELELKKEKVNQAFVDICMVYFFYQPKAEADFSEIEKQVRNGEKDIRSLIRKLIWQEHNFLAAFAEENGLNEERLFFLLFHTAKPFVINYANRFKSLINLEMWHETFCPVCGWEPVTAKTIEGSEHRVLQCSLCDMEWSCKSHACCLLSKDSYLEDCDGITKS